jgi:hypothetical protein
MKNVTASRVQMMGIHPIVFSSVESKKSGLGRSCHETAQLTSHSSSEGFKKRPFSQMLSQPDATGIHHDFFSHITKNTRDHSLSGSAMKQHNKPPAPLTILDRVSGIKIANAQLTGCNWNSPQYFCIQLNQESRRSPLVRFYH